ncbi:hypothetical protein OH76DRAFT_1331760, partial [Lentinus brumalis]
LLLHGVIEHFTLNTEQRRAFLLIATHLHHHDVLPMRMYLGGMGGTSKSRVLLALMDFLKARKEAHRFIVLGPTGSSASLIGGSTYHSILGLSLPSEKKTSTITSLEKLRSRLLRVDLIFIDEVSMISCLDLFHINSRLCLA